MTSSCHPALDTMWVVKFSQSRCSSHVYINSTEVLILHTICHRLRSCKQMFFLHNHKMYIFGLGAAQAISLQREQIHVFDVKHDNVFANEGAVNWDRGRGLFWASATSTNLDHGSMRVHSAGNAYTLCYSTSIHLCNEDSHHTPIRPLWI